MRKLSEEKGFKQNKRHVCKAGRKRGCEPSLHDGQSADCETDREERGQKVKTADLVCHFGKEGLHCEDHEKSLKSVKQGSDNLSAIHR